MQLQIRVVFAAAGLCCAVLSVGYFIQLPWALGTWPWVDGRLSNIFISSMLAAIALPLIWIGFSGQFGATAGGFLHLAVILAGAAAVFFGAAATHDPGRLNAYGTGAVSGAVACALLAAWSHRQPTRDPRRLPNSLRTWFVLYIMILVPAGLALLNGVAGIMPWPIKPETSALYGWIFLAAVCSFAYPVLRPQAEYANVGLFGFLAYDVVLIPPFLAHFKNVKPEFMTTLVVYTSVLCLTAMVSIWYLFVCAKTRIQV